MATTAVYKAKEMPEMEGTLYDGNGVRQQFYVCTHQTPCRMNEVEAERTGRRKR